MKKLLIALALFFASTGIAHAQDQTIEIKNFMFMVVTVTAGSKVTWVNRDQVPHTVVEKNKLFRSAALDTDDSYSYVFTAPGTYEYFCSLHPQMVAKVIVTAPPPPARKPARKRRPG